MVYSASASIEMQNGGTPLGYLVKQTIYVVMAIASSVSAFAENVVYGIVPSSSFGGKTTSFDIDAVKYTNI